MPKVSFIVPCYKLAHLMSECIFSILAQTYEDFEILIMDDCSPDNTPEAAHNFSDPRVIYIRNEVNLGHLRNYNKGIELSRGKYVWLISADDRLRRPYVLERYISLMEAHPEVGYVFCPGIGMDDYEETHLLEYSHHGDEDTIFEGRKFLSENLLKYNSILAASGMVRKQLYEKLGTFPLDLPYAGDWYLWCLFALHSDVGYFADPMVNYRQHQLSITNTFNGDRAKLRIADDISSIWRIKRVVEETDYNWLIEKCDDSIAQQYAYYLTGKKYGVEAMLPIEFEKSILFFSNRPEEINKIKFLGYLLGGDLAYWNGNHKLALSLYRMALKIVPFNPSTVCKYLLLHLGKLGDHIREGFGKIRAFMHLSIPR